MFNPIPLFSFFVNPRTTESDQGECKHYLLSPLRHKVHRGRIFCLSGRRFRVLYGRGTRQIKSLSPPDRMNESPGFNAPEGQKLFLQSTSRDWRKNANLFLSETSAPLCLERAPIFSGRACLREAPPPEALRRAGASA